MQQGWARGLQIPNPDPTSSFKTAEKMSKWFQLPKRSVLIFSNCEPKNEFSILLELSYV